MAKRLAGTCYVKVNGEQLELSGSMTCSMSSTTKEAVMSVNGVAGYKETAVAPKIKGTFIIGSDFPLSSVVDGTDLTVTAELANGSVFTLSDAFVTGEVEYSADDGTAEIEFTGINGNWA